MKCSTKVILGLIVFCTVASLWQLQQAPFSFPVLDSTSCFPASSMRGYVANKSPKAGEPAVLKKQSYLKPESSD